MVFWTLDFLVLPAYGASIVLLCLCLAVALKCNVRLIQQNVYCSECYWQWRKVSKWEYLLEWSAASGLALLFLPFVATFVAIIVAIMGFWVPYLVLRLFWVLSGRDIGVFLLLMITLALIIAVILVAQFHKYRKRRLKIKKPLTLTKQFRRLYFIAWGLALLVGAVSFSLLLQFFSTFLFGYYMAALIIAAAIFLLWLLLWLMLAMPGRYLLFMQLILQKLKGTS